MYCNAYRINLDIAHSSSVDFVYEYFSLYASVIVLSCIVCNVTLFVTLRVYLVCMKDILL